MISVEPPPISKISAPLIFAADQGRAAQGGKIGFLFGGDHFQRDARFVAGAARSGYRRCRPAAPPGWRWRGHGWRRCLAMRSAQIFSAAMVRSMAASDSMPVAGDALAQPHDAGKGIHHPEIAPARRGGRSEAGNCWCRDPAPPAPAGQFRAVPPFFFPCCRRPSGSPGPTLTGAADDGERRLNCRHRPLPSPASGRARGHIDGQWRSSPRRRFRHAGRRPE